MPPATQEAILAEMFSLVRPGGTVALQEYDAISYVCYPEHPSWKLLCGIFNDTFHAAGGNDFVGRSLGHLLRSAGAQNLEMRTHVELPKVGEYQRTHLLSLIEARGHGLTLFAELVATLRKGNRQSCEASSQSEVIAA